MKVIRISTPKAGDITNKPWGAKVRTSAGVRRTYSTLAAARHAAVCL